MKVFALRLHPADDLRQSLKSFAQTQQIQAGFILSAIGSLRQAAIRFADQPQSTVLQAKFEILSLAGTLSVQGVHIHMAIADAQGRTIGGHLCEGCIIHTTAEIAIGVSEELIFLRELDPQTGFRELRVQSRLDN